LIRGYVKALLFLSSYIPLYIILILKNLTNEALIWILGIVTGISLCFLLYVLYKARKMNGEYYTLEEAECDNGKFIEYILAYIIPFLGFNMGNIIDLISVGIIFVLIGALYIRSDLIYMNPMLNFLGYDLYKVKSNKKTYMLLSKNDLSPSKKTKIYELGRGFGVAK
jgi:hypothetical protein